MILLKSVIGLALACLPAFAQDWPQWGGSGRDFKTTATELRARWPANGPPQLWNRSLGEGHSAIVAEGGRLYTMYRKGEQEVVIALDAKTGKTIWEYSYAAPYWRGMDMSYGDGPHATPLIVGQSLYTAGVTGKLFCLEKSTGKPRWSHELWQGFTGGTHMGYSSSPLAYKNTLIMQADGARRSLMAFDLNSGRVVWQALNFRISNSSPIIINVDGQEQLVVFTHGEILGADDVKTGSVLWQDRRFSHANFVYADGKFIILDEDGALGLATPTDRGLTVHSQIEILTSRSWTAPTLVGRTLYLRDRKNIMALQL